MRRRGDQFYPTDTRMAFLYAIWIDLPRMYFFGNRKLAMDNLMEAEDIWTNGHGLDIDPSGRRWHEVASIKAVHDAFNFYLYRKYFASSLRLTWRLSERYADHILDEADFRAIEAAAFESNPRDRVITQALLDKLHELNNPRPLSTIFRSLDYDDTNKVLYVPFQQIGGEWTPWLYGFNCHPLLRHGAVKLMTFVINTQWHTAEWEGVTNSYDSADDNPTVNMWPEFVDRRLQPIIDSVFGPPRHRMQQLSFYYRAIDQDDDSIRHLVLLEDSTPYPRRHSNFVEYASPFGLPSAI